MKYAQCWWLCGLLLISFAATFLSPDNLHQSILGRGAVEHFSLPTFSAYTTLSTLFDRLWMRAASAARQCVCDLGGVISQGLTTLSVSYKKLLSQ